MSRDPDIPPPPPPPPPPPAETDLRRGSFEQEYGPVTKAPSFIGDWVADEKQYYKEEAAWHLAWNAHRGAGCLAGGVLGFVLFCAVLLWSWIIGPALASPLWVFVLLVCGGGVFGAVAIGGLVSRLL